MRAPGPGVPVTPSPRETSGYVPRSGSYSVPLGLGIIHPDVTPLQNFLKSLSPDIYPEGLVTGYFGPLTERAVGRFQIKHGLAKPGDPAFGYVGPKTRAKINQILGL